MEKATYLIPRDKAMENCIDSLYDKDNKRLAPSRDTFIKAGEQIRHAEDLFNKTVFDFTAEESIEYILSANLTSYLLLRSNIDKTLVFIRYCIANNYVNKNLNDVEFMNIDATEIDYSENIKKTYIKDDIAFMNIINKIFVHPSFQDNHRNISIPILLWLGIHIKDLVRLREDAFDFENKRIKYKGGYISIEDQMQAMILKSAINQNSIIVQRNVGFTEIPLFKSVYFLKKADIYQVNRKIDQVNLNKIYKCFGNINDIIGRSDVSINNNILLESGVYYRTYLEEQLLGCNVNFTDRLRLLSEEGKDISASKQNTLGAATRAFRYDYNMYKKAFWE